MILSEKITELRKKNGLSQEEFGAEIGVSRQAVSKWEMAQATPDLNKIMKISDFFGVPTDFLLKDEYDLTFLDNNVGFKNVNSDENGKITDLEKVSSNTKMIELSEIQSYLDINRKSARNFVIAIFLFFVSPFAGIVISTFNEPYAIVGLVIQLLILIVVAMIIVLTIWELSKHKILGSGETELAYGVRSVIEERKKGFEPTFLKGIIFGIICFLAFVIPIIVVSAFTDDNNVAIIIASCIMLLIFATGVSVITYVVIINRGYNTVLKIN